MLETNFIHKKNKAIKLNEITNIKLLCINFDENFDSNFNESDESKTFICPVFPDCIDFLEIKMNHMYENYNLDNIPSNIKELKILSDCIINFNLKLFNLPISLEKVKLIFSNNNKINNKLHNKLRNNIKLPYGCKLYVNDKIVEL